LCQEKEKYIHCQGKREEVCEFIQEQLRKRYLRPSKSPQTALVFFVGKKDGVMN